MSAATNQVQAAIQATFYDDENPQVIGNVTVPGEKTILYTATSDFITDAVAVEQIGVDYATLALNSLTPIRFTIRNTGLNDVRNLTVSLGSGETATLTETLLPNESTTLTVWHHVEDHVTDPRYTITAADGINEERQSVSGLSRHWHLANGSDCGERRQAHGAHDPL